MFLICPSCLQARPGPLQSVGFRCISCRYSWEALDARFAKAYYGKLEDLEVSLATDQGAVLNLLRLPAEIGRDTDFLPLQKNLAVSRRHCQLSFEPVSGQFLVRNFEGAADTFIDSQQVGDKAAVALQPGAVLRVGGVALRLRVQLKRDPPTTPAHPSGAGFDLSGLRRQALLFLDASGAVGIAEETLAEGNVIAYLRRNRTDGGWRMLAVQRSKVRLNGEMFLEQELRPFDQVTLADVGFHFNPTTDALAPDQAGAGPTLELSGASVFVSKGFSGQQCLLRDVACRFPGGRLTAVIGLSGSGKSSLLKVLSGAFVPQTGSIRVDGREMAWSEYAQSWARANLALVPQADVMHGELSVRGCLEFAAALQARAGRSRAEQRQRVDKVLAELNLEAQQDQPIHSLSGGERKRVNVASELLAAPAVLLLDEPTTGLDFFNEREVIRQLRQLSRQGRTVVFVTHSLASLDSVDHVVFVRKTGEGGEVQFQETGEQVRRRFEQGSEQLYAPPAAVRLKEDDAGETKRIPSFLPQFLILTLRYWRRWSGNRLTFTAFFLAIPFFLGVLIRVAKAGRDPNDMDRLLYGVIAAFWLGMNESVREIVRERDIFLREHGRGVGAFSYLLSKLFFFGCLGFVQGMLLSLGLKFLTVDGFDVHLSLSDHNCSWLVLWGTLWLAVVVGCVAGLFLSAICLFIRQQGEVVAVLLVILVTLPQFLFSAKMMPTGHLVDIGELQQYRSFGLRQSESARLPEILSYGTVSRYLFLPLEPTVMGYRDLDKIFLFNFGILIAAGLTIVVLTWILLETNVIWQKRF